HTGYRTVKRNLLVLQITASVSAMWAGNVIDCINECASWALDTGAVIMMEGTIVIGIGIAIRNVRPWLNSTCICAGSWLFTSMVGHDCAISARHAIDISVAAPYADPSARPKERMNRPVFRPGTANGAPALRNCICPRPSRGESP